MDNHAGRQPCAPAAPFARLRFSRVEAESIASVAGETAIALDFDAARATLARPEFRHAGILHFEIPLARFVPLCLAVLNVYAAARAMTSG